MWQDSYKKWREYKDLDPALKQDLEGKSQKELEDMFYGDLVFGTGGMRGILGAGTNRMNIYTIRKANDGLARYLVDKYPRSELKRGVVIAHDNRRMSREFAAESAKLLGTYGIKAFLFDALRPTPELSFAVRFLKAISGIVITASHNPPIYNGYKIYDEYGCQYTPAFADLIVQKVAEVKDIFSVRTMEFSDLEMEGLVEYIGENIDYEYLKLIKTVQIHPEVDKKIKIVFTPLHGTSAMLATHLLSETGYEFYPVREQMVHDPEFATVKSPNPENPAAFTLAIALGKMVGADLLIATDPDADRLGIAVKTGDDYTLMTGNQTGAVLIHYLLSEKKRLGLLPKKGVVFNTIVTSDLGAKIARNYGFEVISTLTGFKYIGEQARLLEGTDRKFLFGYEESYGYVINDGVRDKDSFQALLLAAEAAAFFKQEKNQTLYDVLLDLYKQYGYHIEDLMNIELDGFEGKKRIDRIMTYFQEHHFQAFIGRKVECLEDYDLGIRYLPDGEEKLTLPQSEVIKYVLDDGSWFVLRPSGTEPKLKVYAAAVAWTLDQAKTKVARILADLRQIIDKIV